MTRRVVITGMGTVSPLGIDPKSYWHGLITGRSGIGPLEQLDTSVFKLKFGGYVINFEPEKPIEPRAAKRLDRFAQFALVAAIAAVKESGLDIAREDPLRCGCILGSGIGGQHEYEEQHVRFMQAGPGRISPFVIPKMMNNAGAGQYLHSLRPVRPEYRHFHCVRLGRQCHRRRHALHPAR